MKISKIKELIRLVEDSKINELEVRYSIFNIFNIFKIIIKKYENKNYNYNNSDTGDTKSTNTKITNDISQDSKNKDGLENKINNTIKQEENEYVVKSEMVGFIRIDNKNYLKQGDIVKKGQTLCIIETMKIPTDIKSKYSGIIKEICVKNNQAVQYGQNLFIIQLK
ncbi:MAG: biotin/lipoyl-containing protein [Candidatus Woesearchaeota archaeon]